MRVFCGACGSTIAPGEEHLPCDVCRALDARIEPDPLRPPAARWAAPISFAVASVPGEAWVGDGEEPLPAFDDEWEVKFHELPPGVGF